MRHYLVYCHYSETVYYASDFPCESIDGLKYWTRHEDAKHFAEITHHALYPKDGDGKASCCQVYSRLEFKAGRHKRFERMKAELLRNCGEDTAG